MSRTTREQRTLAAVDGQLTSAAPRLAAQLAIFTWLSADEEMPAHEQIPPARHHPHLAKLQDWSLACLLLWLITTAAMLTAAVTLSGGGPACPAPASAAVCTWQARAPHPPASGTATMRARHPAG